MFIFAEFGFLLLIAAVVIWAIKPFKKNNTDEHEDKK